MEQALERITKSPIGQLQGITMPSHIQQLVRKLSFRNNWPQNKLSNIEKILIKKMMGLVLGSIMHKLQKVLQYFLSEAGSIQASGIKIIYDQERLMGLVLDLTNCQAAVFLKRDTLGLRPEQLSELLQESLMICQRTHLPQTSTGQLYLQRHLTLTRFLLLQKSIRKTSK